MISIIICAFRRVPEQMLKVKTKKWSDPEPNTSSIIMMFNMIKHKHYQRSGRNEA